MNASCNVRVREFPGQNFFYLSEASTLDKRRRQARDSSYQQGQRWVASERQLGQQTVAVMAPLGRSDGKWRSAGKEAL